MSGKDPFGLFVVDKPVGPTSHDVVQTVRRGLDLRRVGHTGTLDPRASGVLLLCLGRATRLSEYLSESPKRYQALIHFGRATDTYDAEGRVVEESGRSPTRREIERALEDFLGRQSQQPPAYSAIKIKGEPAYAAARRGEAPELQARQVTMHELVLRRYQPPRLELEVYCSAGTYVRSLAHDLGRAVGTGAYLAELRRTHVGSFGLDRAVPLAEVERALEAGSWPELMVPAAEALPDWPLLRVEGSELEGLRHGRQIAAEEGSQGLARAVNAQGELVAVIEASPGGEFWQPRKVFLS